MAIKHDLLICGGSDFHGIIKPNIKLGVGRGGMKIQKYLLDKIKEL